jgi:hypothetical protein
MSIYIYIYIICIIMQCQVLNKYRERENTVLLSYFQEFRLFLGPLPQPETFLKATNSSLLCTFFAEVPVPLRIKFKLLVWSTKHPHPRGQSHLPKASPLALCQLPFLAPAELTPHVTCPPAASDHLLLLLFVPKGLGCARTSFLPFHLDVCWQPGF